MLCRYDEIATASHRLKVLRYNEERQLHECKVVGEDHIGTVRVDLFVSGDLPQDVNPNDLIGKTVQVDYTHGYEFLAEGARIISDAE